MTPLHYAAAAGDVGVCSVLLQQYQTVLLHVRDNLGKTALHHALYWNRLPVAILLIQQGAQVTSFEDTYGNTPLTLIYHLNDEALVSLMQELLSKGLHLEEPLLLYFWYRTMWGLNSNFVKPLCDSGVDVNSIDAIGLASIHYAAIRGDVGMVQRLVEAGVDAAAARTQDGRLALHLVVQRRQSTLLQQNAALLEKVSSDDLATALFAAISAGNFAAAAIILRQEQLKLTQREWQYVADVTDRHLPLSRPLIRHVRDTAVATRFLAVSARLGYTDVVRELLDSRAPLCNCQDFMGRTALHEAVQAEVDGSRRKSKIIGLLLSQPQLDPNIQDQRGETALHYACRAGRVGVVDTLLSDERIQPFMQVGNKLVTAFI